MCSHYGKELLLLCTQNFMARSHFRKKIIVHVNNRAGMCVQQRANKTRTATIDEVAMKTSSELLAHKKNTEMRSNRLRPRSVARCKGAIHRIRRKSGTREGRKNQIRPMIRKRNCFLDISRKNRANPDFLGSKVHTRLVVEHISKERQLLARNHKIFVMQTRDATNIHRTTETACRKIIPTMRNMKEQHWQT